MRFVVPKQGGVSLPANWRLIAILHMFYNICFRMLYNRLLPQFDRCRHIDQFSFRHGVRIEDALVVVQTLISKTLEWNLLRWMASLDLTKSFWSC